MQTASELTLQASKRHGQLAVVALCQPAAFPVLPLCLTRVLRWRCCAGRPDEPGMACKRRWAQRQHWELIYHGRGSSQALSSVLPSSGGSGISYPCPCWQMEWTMRLQQSAASCQQCWEVHLHVLATTTFVQGLRMNDRPLNGLCLYFCICAWPTPVDIWQKLRQEAIQNPPPSKQPSQALTVSV